MKCNFCGTNLNGYEKYCHNCGSKVVSENTTIDEFHKSTESARSTSIVLGVISLIGLFFIIFTPISLILSFIGLILAIKSNHNSKNTAGIIINGVSLFLSVVFMIVISLVIYFGFFAIDKGIDKIIDYNNRIYERS